MQSFVDEASYTGNRTINMPEEDPNAYYYGFNNGGLVDLITEYQKKKVAIVLRADA